jgi:hypothetical protein
VFLNCDSCTSASQWHCLEGGWKISYFILFCGHKIQRNNNYFKVSIEIKQRTLPLKMEAVGSSKTLVNTFYYTKDLNPEAQEVILCHHENLESHIKITVKCFAHFCELFHKSSFLMWKKETNKI